MSNLKLPNFEYNSIKDSLPAKYPYSKLVAYKTQGEVASLWKRVKSNDENPYGYTTEERELYVVIYHHNNRIAEIGPDNIWVSNAGWASKTTAQRLTAILRDNGYNYPIRIRNYEMVIEINGEHVPFSTMFFEKN